MLILTTHLAEPSHARLEYLLIAGGQQGWHNPKITNERLIKEARILMTLASKNNARIVELEECLVRYRSESGQSQQKSAEEFSRQLYPLLLKSARYHMRSGSQGRDLSSPEDLAQEVWLKICEKDELLPDFQIGEGFSTYLSNIVLNSFRDDKRRLNGRNDNMPRVYVHDSEILEGIASEKRSQSGYAQLRQTIEILRRYLRQLPGKMFFIPTNVRSDTPGRKPVTLTENHANLLKLWMNPENEDLTWKGLAELTKPVGTPVGTLKRWFSEVTVHLCTDPGPDAQRLREVYNIKIPFDDDASDNPDDL